MNEENKRYDALIQIENKYDHSEDEYILEHSSDDFNNALNTAKEVVEYLEDNNNSFSRIYPDITVVIKNNKKNVEYVNVCRDENTQEIIYFAY